MITPVIIVGVMAWLTSALVSYLFVRKTAFNLLDPLILVGISVPFSAALLAVLCVTGLVSWNKFALFNVVLLGYLIGARTVGAFFSRKHFRKIILDALSGVSIRQVRAFFVLTVCATLVLAVLGLEAGAQGDARQGFAKIFRPLIVLQSGFFLFSLVLLLTRKIPTSKATVWLLILVLCSLPFSGKSVLIPVVYWFGLKMYLEERRVTIRASLALLLLLFMGVGISGVLAYGVTGFAGLMYLFTNRLWLSGDVYIYAYQQNALDAIRSHYPVSFLSYMTHPLTSLVGIRGYEKPLGAMLSSEVTGDNLLTGPNPQLPVVLDYFFPDSMYVPFLIAFILGFLVVGFRPLGIYFSTGRSRYMKLGGIVAAIFCPSAGFLDTSQVLITVVGIAAVTFIGIFLEMLFAKPHQAPSAHFTTQDGRGYLQDNSS